jgi:hypothetical protein
MLQKNPIEYLFLECKNKKLMHNIWKSILFSHIQLKILNV